MRASQSIFEIGRRLKHVKENNLQYGEFGKWLDEIGIDHSFAKRSIKISSELNIDSAHVHQFIKIANEFEKSNVNARLHLGVRALYQLATMPEEEHIV